MLILARKIGQKIVIGDDIELTVVDIRGDQVRLGITAPRHVSIDRKELREKILAEKAEAEAAKIADESSSQNTE